MTTNKRIVFIGVSTCIALGGCWSGANIEKYHTETAKAIIDAGNTVGLAIFCAAWVRGFMNK